MLCRRTALVALLLSLTMSGCASPDRTSAQTAPRPAALAESSAAERFLTLYVAQDGRVIRRDQGGDIVSEGQAYAMLIAELAGRPALLRTIWAWTASHLTRPDGLFAWHASGSGQVEDPQSASDADTLIAYALLRYSGPDSETLHQAGLRVAEAILANESVPLPDGAPVLVAGPWARSSSTPAVNPSYLMPGVFEALARLTGDRRWDDAVAAAVALMQELTKGGRVLPPDWAQLTGSRLVAAAQPGGGAGVQYSFAAARVPIWFATACSGAARMLAANWWRNVLGSDDRSGASSLSLDGVRMSGGSSPVPLMAGAAAADAAGDRAAARELRAGAEAVSLRAPTYYGDAWSALGAALLDGSISPCREVRPR